MKKHSFLRFVEILAIVAIIPFGNLVAQKPVAPANLKVDSIIGHQVHLSWANPDTGVILHQMGFETLSADTISFTDGWTVKTTNASDYACTWFNFPSPDIMAEGGDYDMMIHSGKRSATVFPDFNESGDHKMHQDEWLISPVISNAAYLQFSHLTTPEIVENGADPDYPDHYVVLVSTDGGETWGEPLWDARYNADMSEDWQTTTLALAAVPTENMRIAFRAYGEYQVDENNDTINQSLYGAWAIDDIIIRAMASDEPAEPAKSTSKELFADDFEAAADNMETSIGGKWSIRTAYVEQAPEDPDPSAFTYGWFRNPIMEDDETFAMMLIDGQRSAFVMPGYDLQDEWMISPRLPVNEDSKIFLSFDYLSTGLSKEDNEFISDSTIGHYTVSISKDKGNTWTTVWDALKDDKGSMQENGFYGNSIKLPIDDIQAADSIQIAFHAYGVIDEEQELNGALTAAWIIDNVRIVDSAVSSTPGHSTISRYRITIDDEELDEVYGTTYVDNSAKTPGEHTYSVYSVSANGAESEPVSVKVNLPELHFDAPRNFTCTPSFDEATGRYSVMMTWEAPESDFQPASYTIYNGDLIFGAELTEKEGQEGIGISGCFGVYRFSIVAVYQTPDGESEPVVRNLALGVRFGVNDLKVEATGNNVDLSWTAPFESEYEMDSYTIYRGEEKIAEGLKTTSYQDKDVKDGYYQYSVIVVYKDGVESIRSSVPLQVGEAVLVPMPYSQAFNTTFCPENWKVVNQSQRTPDKYIWYFDDRSRLGVKGEGFEGCYAAIDCLDAPGYSRDATLELPVIDLSSANDRSSITLSFYYSLGIASGSICKVGTEWSLDGEDWNVLEVIDPSTGFTPSEDGDFHTRQAVQTLGDYPEILDAVNNADALYLRIHYTANRSKFFALDNVLVTSDGRVANQTTEKENVDINVSASHGLISIDALQASIQNVEVFSMQGMRLLERKGNGEAFMTLPAPKRGPAIVRVTTGKGIKVAKLFL